MPRAYVAADHNGLLGEVRHDCDAAGGCRLHGAYAVVEQLPNIHLGKGKPLPPHIDFRNVQELFHQLRHAVAFLQDHLRSAARIHYARLYPGCAEASCA